MKINIIHMGFFYRGGGEKVALEQAIRLKNRGHDVKLFAPVIREGKSFDFLMEEARPQPIIRLPTFPVMNEALAMLFVSTLPYGVEKLADCDVMLCHSQPSMWIGYRTSRLLGTPYVGYLHQITTFINRRPEDVGRWAKADFTFLDLLLGSRLTRPLARDFDLVAHAKARALVFNSYWTKSLFRKAYGLDGGVIYPGIGVLPTPPMERQNMIITSSRHYPWKRIDLALRILKMLPQPTPQFMVIGSQTKHTESLRSLAKALELLPYVSFTDEISYQMMCRFYAQALCYVQTSIQEPFGMGPVEAQASGTPAIVWGEAGLKETVSDGESGYWAKPFDLNDYTTKLHSVISSYGKPEWTRMSHAARIWANQFNWDSHIDKLEDVLVKAA